RSILSPTRTFGLIAGMTAPQRRSDPSAPKLNMPPTSTRDAAPGVNGLKTSGDQDLPRTIAAVESGRSRSYRLFHRVAMVPQEFVPSMSIGKTVDASVPNPSRHVYESRTLLLSATVFS